MLKHTFLDRFLHHAEIITITGRSYRLRAAGRGGKDATDSKSAEKSPDHPCQE